MTVNVGPEKVSKAMPPINPAIDALNQPWIQASWNKEADDYRWTIDIEGNKPPLEFAENPQ